MSIKKFNEFNYIKENILDDDDSENERKWEIKVDGKTDSYWEYKHDAIDQIIEILDTNGDENGLDGYKDEDDYEMSKGEIADMLDELDEGDFYDKLDELKEFIGYDNDIRLINLNDEDEIEFLEESYFVAEGGDLEGFKKKLKIGHNFEMKDDKLYFLASEDEETEQQLEDISKPFGVKVKLEG